jgi:type IV pilus assembly protein PilC
LPEFQYQGVDKQGKKVAGKIDAPSEGELRMILRAQGVRPVRIGRVSVLAADLKKIGGGSGKVQSLALFTFTRQLHVLISSGVPLVQAMDVLVAQTNDKTLKSIIIATKEKVSQGSFFWESLSMYPKAFPRIYTSLIRAGESSGALDTMLKRLTRYLEDADRLKKTLKGAMMYPAIVVIVGILVIAALLTFVIPKFEALLTGSGQELPLPTQIVINISDVLVENFPFIVLGGGASAFLFVRYAASDAGRGALQKLFFRFPLFGDLMQKGAVARFSRTMGTLLSSGVTLLDALEICRSTVGNAVIEHALTKVRGDIESGKPFASSIGRLGVFPEMAVQMISVGESTGSLDAMLDRVADFYETEVEMKVQGMSKLIEPLILVVFGGIVGGILIAMYLPIFQMAGGADGM